MGRRRYWGFFFFSLFSFWFNLRGEDGFARYEVDKARLLPSIHVIDKRAAHPPTSSHPIPLFYLLPSTIPPDHPQTGRKCIEQEGRLPLAAQAIKNKAINSIREIVRRFNMPESTL